MITGTIRMVGGFVIGTGIGLVSNHLVDVATPENASKFGKICIKVGVTAVGMLVAKRTGDYLDEVIDETVDSVKAVKHELKKNKIFKKKATV